MTKPTSTISIPPPVLDLIRRLVTPPNGIVLDPFMGSGSTGKACAYEGFDFIGIDQSAEYVEIARARIAFVEKHTEQVLFPKNIDRPELVFDDQPTLDKVMGVEG